MQKQQVSVKKYVDPVCHMEVSGKRTDIQSIYRSKTYYFCAESCKKEFESEPEKFLASKPPKKKGWWGRHVERLAKVSCDRSMECH